MIISPRSLWSQHILPFTLLVALPFMGEAMAGYMTRVADMIVTGA